MAKRKSFLPGRNMSVRLSLYLFILNGLTLLVGTWISYQFSSGVIRKNTDYYAKHYVDSLNSELNFYIRDIDLMTLSLFYMNDRLFAGLDDNIAKLELRNFFDGFRNSRDYISDIFLVSPAEEVAGSTSVAAGDLLGSELYKTIRDSDGELVFAPIGKASFVQNEYTAEKEVLFVGRKIKSPQTNATVGIVIVTLAADRLTPILARPEKRYEEQLLLLDRKGRLLYRENGLELPDKLRKLVDSSGYGRSSAQESGYLLVSGNEEMQRAVTVIALIPEKALLRDAAVFRNVLLSLNAVLLLIGMALAAMLAYRFLRPVVQLSYFLRDVGSRKLVPYEAAGMKDEIGFLIASYNRMIRRLKQLFRRIELEREKQRKAEVLALQAQINPHFIYNTLNNVRWLARAGRNDTVFDALTSLGVILVSSFRFDQPVVSIREELKHLQAYLDIQATMHPGKFEVGYDFPDGLEAEPIVRMSLQPIVENAIMHGILPKTGAGRIRLSGKREGGFVYVQVADDGIGAASAGGRPSAKGNRREHVGMLNVDRRIKLYFGDEYGLRWTSEPGAGTTVTLKLPVMDLIREKRII
ncbi:cache domain-containing sensor histidine kinase [Paenibacillus sp. GYB003]|uniref:cache domain-containing sensor histidine kinase n=1 Tax=Paenibacillus sp. GYB003 TaxID=2994392 RepID=UPI002F9663C9